MDLNPNKCMHDRRQLGYDNPVGHSCSHCLCIGIKYVCHSMYVVVAYGWLFIQVAIHGGVPIQFSIQSNSGILFCCMHTSVTRYFTVIKHVMCQDMLIVVLQ